MLLKRSLYNNFNNLKKLKNPIKIPKKTGKFLLKRKRCAK